MAPPTLVLRREAFEMGFLPLQQLFPKVATIQSLQVAECFGAPLTHATLLLDTLRAVLPPLLAADAQADLAAIDVYLLLVFLMLQNYQRPNNHKMTGDTWPSQLENIPGSPTSTMPESPTKASAAISAARSKSSASDDALQLSYVQKHLGTALELLKDTEKKGALTAARLDRLGLALKVTELQGSPTATVSSVLAAPVLAAGGGAASPEKVQQWLAANTGAAPPASRLSMGAAASPAGGAGESAGAYVAIEGLVKTTVVQRQAELGQLDSVRVADCQDAVIYLLAAMSHVALVDLCERVHVVSASQRLRVSSCRDSVFCVAVNAPPVVLGDCRRLQLAPYNTYYERLDAHLALAGVKTSPNCWDQPLNLTSPRSTTNSPIAAQPSVSAQEASSKLVVSLLPPEKFLPFMVPFRVPPVNGVADGKERSTHTNPFTMPQAYASALEQKVHTVEEMRRMVVKEAGLDAGTKCDLQTVIQTYFKEWLVQSGNIRQVHDLIRMERDEI